MDITTEYDYLLEETKEQRQRREAILAASEQTKTNYSKEQVQQIISDSITRGGASQCEVRKKLLELCQRISHNLLEWRRKVEEEKRIEENGEGLVLLEVRM